MCCGSCLKVMVNILDVRVGELISSIISYVGGGGQVFGRAFRCICCGGVELVAEC